MNTNERPAVNRAVVLSVPHNGTHFTVWLLQEVLGITTEYCHMEPAHEERIQKRLAVMRRGECIVVPVRFRDSVMRSFMARRGHAPDFDANYEVFESLLPWLAMHRLMFLPVEDIGQKLKLMWRLAEFLGLNGLKESQLEFGRRWPVVRSYDADTRGFRDCEIDLDKANRLVSKAGKLFYTTIEHRP